MNKKFNIYQTERLILIPTSQQDAQFILELLNTPKWIQYIGDRNVYSIEGAKQYIAKKITPQFERLGFGNYTVVRKSDNAKLGTCGLYDREGLTGVDIGFGFLPNYEGKGYALESSLKLKELALDSFGLKQISAITNIDNISSQKLLEKLGLQYLKIIQLPESDEQLRFYQLNIDDNKLLE